MLERRPSSSDAELGNVIVVSIDGDVCCNGIFCNEITVVYNLA
jgi:hypothetical protein